MRAAVYHDRGRVDIQQMPEPRPGPNEVLLQVGTVGVCGTDASEYAHGPSMFPIHTRHPVTGHVGPLIPGHEFSGTVVEVGAEVTGLEVGDLVASGAGISCGECPQCRAGATNVCRRYATVGLNRHGALAEYVTTPADICVEVASLGLSADDAALLQPMAIAHHAYRRGRPDHGQPVVIVGVGGIGTFLTYVAARSGGEVIAVDVDPRRLEVAGSLGASRALDPGRQDPREVVSDLDALPVIYEATGVPAGFASAWEMVPAGARLVAVGIQKEPLAVDLPVLTVGEREVIGTNAHAVAVDLPAAARLVAAREEGWSDIAPVVLPLESLVDDALIPMVEGRSSRIKSLFDPGADNSRPFRV